MNDDFLFIEKFFSTDFVIEHLSKASSVYSTAFTLVEYYAIQYDIICLDLACNSPI